MIELRYWGKTIIILLSCQLLYFSLSGSDFIDELAHWSEVERLYNFEEESTTHSTVSRNLIDSPHLNDIQHQQNNPNELNHQSTWFHQSQLITQYSDPLHQSSPQNLLMPSSPPSLSSLIFDESMLQFLIDSPQPVVQETTTVHTPKESQDPPSIYQMHAGDRSVSPQIFSNSATKHSQRPPMNDNHFDDPNHLSTPSKIPTNRGLKRKGDSTSDGRQKSKRKKPTKAKSNAIDPAQCCEFYSKSLSTMNPLLGGPCPNQFHYTLVDYKPQTIDGKLIAAALNNLRILDEDKLFADPGFSTLHQHPANTNRPKASQKMFCLQPCNRHGIQGFFKTFRAFYREKVNESATQPENTQISDGENALNMREIWAQFDSAGTRESQSSEITEYRNLVAPFFSNQSFTLQEDIQRYCRNTNHDVEKLFQMLELAERMLPLYFFYTDMISTIAPIQVIQDNSASLTDHRSKAAKPFYYVISEALCPAKKRDDERFKIPLFIAVAQAVRDQLGRKKTPDAPSFIALIWKLIEFWMVIRRPDLLTGEKMKLQQSVKEFFNALARSLPMLKPTTRRMVQNA